MVQDLVPACTSRVPEDMRKQLTGHSTSGIHHVYAHGHELGALAEAIAKLDGSPVEELLGRAEAELL